MTSRERWVLLGAILASSMAFIDGSALTVALPVLQADLSASGAQLLWVVDAYLLTLAAFMLTGGSLGDKLGRRRVFMAGIGLFSLASLACGLSPNISFLIGMRALQGVGGAMMIPGSLALITAFFGREKRGLAIGTWSAATTLVFVVGPFLGGLLASAGLWRGIFLINLPLAVVALVVLYLKAPESRDEEHGPLDISGALLAAMGLAGLTYGFITAPAAGFGSPRIYGSLTAGVILMAAFVLVEHRSSHPMVPLSMFRSRIFSGANLLTLFLYGALNVVTLFFPLNLIQAQGYSPLEAGLSFLPFTILLAGMSRWAGRLVDRVGPRLPLTVGPFLAGISFLLLALPGLSSGISDYWYTYLPGIVIFGIGMGITVAPLTTTVMSALPERFAGTESGINNAVARVAGLLAIAVMGSVALLVFAGRLEANTQKIDLPDPARQALKQEAARLGEASVPPEVKERQAPLVNEAIKTSFVQTFRLVMTVCAVLAGISVAMTLLLVRNNLAGKEKISP